MNENTANDTPGKRSFATGSIYGNTPEEMEMAALNQARSFFGTDVPLEIVRTYRVVNAPEHASASNPDGKSWYAAIIIVREL